MTPEQQQRVNAISRTPISMMPVESSQITEIGHDPNTNTLAVRFQPRAGETRGGLYHYAGVDAELFATLAGASSVGSFFHNKIRPNTTDYPYVRVEEAVKADSTAAEARSQEAAA